jgi:hypothetical protein
MHGMGADGPANARPTEASGPSLHVGTEHRIVRSRWCAIGSVATGCAALPPKGAGGGDAPYLLAPTDPRIVPARRAGRRGGMAAPVALRSVRERSAVRRGPGPLCSGAFPRKTPDGTAGLAESSESGTMSCLRL